ncbi:MAG: TonB-dependent receptor [Cyanobacteria bacterium]|nr:TonB-dependent receptor [Cyanobacteriota bacterium]
MVAAARLLVFISSVLVAAPSPAFAQQRGAISGKVLDPDGLALPGATVVVTNAATGFIREVVTADTGAYSVASLEPGTYEVAVTMAGFGSATRTGMVLAPGASMVIELKLTVAGVKENVVVTGESPLVERTSNQIGGTLSRREIEEVPSNFRNFTGLTQLIPGMTPNQATSTFEGGQVVANGSPSQQNVYLLDGMYNNDDRLGGSQGTQVRVVLDNIEEYQVLANQYSSEFGGGAGAIINMVTRGGTNDIRGRLYSYFRDEALNARGKFLTAGQPKPPERTLQAGFGLGGPIIRNRAHFYFTYERDNEDISGQKRFPAAAAPLAVDQVGFFTVRAANYFARTDLQINDRNFLNVRWLLENAASRGEGFNTNNETADARVWEADHDTMWGATYTSVLTDGLSSVTRVGRIDEALTTAPQGFFNDAGKAVGFDGRDPFSIGQRNQHPSYITGTGGTGPTTLIFTYVVDQAFSYFIPNLLGGEHTLKAGGGYSWNTMNPRSTFDSGTFQFRTDAPYNPADPATYPFQFDVTVGPPSNYGYDVVSKDQRRYAFVEDKWSVTGNLTLNLGLRWDSQKQTPNHNNAFAPRVGVAWDAFGTGRTVVRGGVGKFYAYVPVVHDLTLQQSGVRTLFPSISINASSPNANLVLIPDMITDTAGNPGVARLSPAGQAVLNRLRDEVLAGTGFNRNPRIDSPGRKMPHTWSWSAGVSQELFRQIALSVDYVANASRNQLGVIDINEPVNGVRPGVAVFDPTSTLIPAEARGVIFQRVLQSQTSSVFDGDYKSLQVSMVKRMANRWSGRLAYTLQRSNFVGIGTPDSRRVWLDNDPRADYGEFSANRTHVFAASGSWNPWRTLTFATVISAISGAPINETVGRDVNGDLDNNDRPIRGIDDLTMPIRSAVDSQGRAVPFGIRGPGFFTTDLSIRYQLPLGGRLDSLDFFFDVFNVFNRLNEIAPTGNRSSPNFMIATSAQFALQSQLGIRVRF